MDLGFTVSESTQRGILLVFVLYTIAIIGMGIYVKVASRNESASQKLASYLTGGGGLGPVALGMLIFTNLMSSGGMVGGPGLGYGAGFIWSLAVYGSFIVTLISLGSVGKKLAIIKQRTNTQTVIQIFRHRYDSKAFAIIIAIIFIVFLLPYSASQFAGGAKLFAVVTGTGNYSLGVFMFALVTLVYTLSGGIKSLSKIAVIQGFIMLISVLFLYFATRAKVVEQYGSFQEGMAFVAQTNPKLVDANSWTPMTFVGTSLLMTFAVPALPNGLMTALTYKKSRVMVQGAVVGIVCYTIIQLTMSGLGPLGYALNQNLTSGDYVNPMLVSTVLPPWLGGLVIAGSAAAIQSTVAAFLVIIASTVMQDLYRGIVNPKVSDESLARGNLVFTAIAAGIALVIALFPNDYIQLIVNFSIGGIASGFLFPLYLGLYWKKATPAAAISGCLGGVGMYMLATVFKWPVHAIILGLGTSLVLMLAVSPLTKKVKLGIYQVWFCPDYDERYANLSE